MGQSLPIQIPLDQGVEPLGHPVVSLTGKASPWHVRKAERTDMVFLQRQDTVAHDTPSGHQDVQERRAEACLCQKITHNILRVD